jgi:molybdate transport system substrate-binding protein
VFAAASLTDAFEAIAVEFHDTYPELDVELNFAASSELVAAIVDDGAPADVFASADVNNMQRLVDAGRNDGDPATFATNSLEIIVERGNPLALATIDDLAELDVIFVTCDPAVPIGAYTQQVLDAAGVDVTPASLEENVRGIVTKVTAGEADAGIVYVTDVVAAGETAEGVAIPEDVNVIAEYPISSVTEAGNREGAAAFVEFVLGEDGQRILAEFAFGPADAASGAVITSSPTTVG